MAVTDILVGSPTSILIGAYGDAEGSCVNVGTTEGPVKITYTPEHFEKKADQYTGVLGLIKTDEKCTIEMVLNEPTLANIALAMGYPTTAVSGQTLSFGGNSTVTERTIFINGNLTTGTVKVNLYKCVIIGATDISYEKKGKTLAKVTLEVLQDTSKSANAQYGTMVYSATDTTPPTIAMTTPAEGGTVTKNTTGTVTLTFTETTNQIDEGTLIYGNSDDATIQIFNVTTNTAVTLTAGTISYASATKILTFTPTSNWTASDKHLIIISTTVRDTAGNHLANTFIGHFSVTV